MNMVMRIKGRSITNFLRQELFLAASLLASSLVFLYALMATRDSFWRLDFLPEWAYPATLLLSLFAFCVLAHLLIVKWSLGNNPEVPFEGMDPTKKPRVSWQEANKWDPVWQRHPFATIMLAFSALATALSGLAWAYFKMIDLVPAAKVLHLPEAPRNMSLVALGVCLVFGIYLLYEDLFGEPGELSNDQAEQELLEDLTQQ